MSYEPLQFRGLTPDPETAARLEAKRTSLTYRPTRGFLRDAPPPKCDCWSEAEPHEAHCVLNQHRREPA